MYHSLNLLSIVHAIILQSNYSLLILTIKTPDNSSTFPVITIVRRCSLRLCGDLLSTKTSIFDFDGHHCLADRTLDSYYSLSGALRIQVEQSPVLTTRTAYMDYVQLFPSRFCAGNGVAAPSLISDLPENQSGKLRPVSGCGW